MVISFTQRGNYTLDEAVEKIGHLLSRPLGATTIEIKNIVNLIENKEGVVLSDKEMVILTNTLMNMAIFKKYGIKGLT